MNTIKAILRTTETSEAEIGDRMIPAVIYGKGIDNLNIFVSNKDFKKLWRKAGQSSIIILEVDKKKYSALIQDIQVNPVNDSVIHLDFKSVDMDTAIRVDVALEFEGEAPAVKEGNILVKVLHEVEIEAKPADLPSSITVDLTKLINEDSQILVKDLNFGPKVTPIDELDAVVVSVTAPKEEIEGEEAPSLEDIEVEAKGKKESENTPSESTE